MQKKIAFVSKPHHPLAADLLRSLVSFCKSKNLGFIVEDATFEHFTEVFESKGSYETADRAQIWKSAELVVVLGGDGTLISTCRHVRNNSVKVLGVNLGTLGFLNEILPEEMLSCLNTFLNGEAILDTRPLLEIAVSQSNKNYALHAVNDVVINKQALARIFALSLRVNDEEASLLRGDGLIISTPSGSTAYSLAAGGSIVHPSVDALLVTPICPHSLSARPLILHGDATLNVTLGQVYKSDSIFLTVDGQEGHPLQPDSGIVVKKSKHTITFIKSNQHGYFSNLKSKLRWGI